MLIGTIDLDRGSQSQLEAKPVGFIVSHTFQPTRVTFGVVLKPFKLNLLSLLLAEIFVIKENPCCFMTA